MGEVITKSLKKNIALHTGSFLIFLYASIYITFPLIFHLGDFATGVGDELVIAWIQNWVIHALTTDPFSLFDANIYYPYHNSLAFSDLFLTSSILSLLPLKIIGEPIAAVNFTLISSLTLLGFFAYLLIYYLTRQFFPSVLGGMFIIFSPATLDKIVHLQVLASQWVPLSILFFLLFIKKYNTWYLVLSLIFFILQTYNSFLPGYFILFSYLIICIYFWFYKRDSLKKILNKKNALTILVFFLFLVPIISPYYKVSREFNYKRDIRETVHFALQPQDLLYPNQYTRLQNDLVEIFPKNGVFKTGYLGIVLSVLSIITLIYSFIRFKKKDIIFNSFITTSIFGLIMSFGPALHWNGKTIHDPFLIPLPYSLFYYVFPGFQGFRNSARWEMLFVLAIAVTVSMFLFRLFKKLSPVKRSLISIMLMSIIIIEYNFPMKFMEVPQKKDFPKVYSWLSTTSRNTKIIELPIYNWNMWPYTQNELWREYYSTSHFKKMVNGYSGFSPPPWQALIPEILSGFPSGEVVAKLKALGLTHIIVHTKEYNSLNNDKFMVNGKSFPNGTSIIEELRRNQSLKLLKRFNQDYVFAFK